MSPEIEKEILELFENEMPKRAIARKLGIDVRTVRRVLRQQGPSPANVEKQYKTQSKLEPYYELIEQKVKQGLSGSRILREIGEQGYTGGRTILTDYIRKIRGPSHAPRRAFRRFETGPAWECQADWSPYRVSIAGRERVVHCFSMILCYSRYMFVQFHRDERLPSLLSAHVDAFRFFRGTPRTVVYDNMTTVTLGRKGRDILWNPEFLKFARHYLYTPRLCRPRDPNRKGKVEKPFQFIFGDFLKAKTFESWQELNASCHSWLTKIANRRVHSTTRQVPEEAWMAERDFLTALPDTPYPAYRQEIRVVYDDCTISVDGTRYSVPYRQLPPKSTATVRIHPHFIDVLNHQGHIVASHRKPDLPGGLIVEADHYRGIGKRYQETSEQVEHSFLLRFPHAQSFVAGLKQRMKSLYRLHLLEIVKLAALYGDEPTNQAIAHALRYANFNAHAVGRILKQRFPLVCPDCGGRGFSGITHYRQINDVETGSLEDYRQYSRDNATDYGKEKE